MGFVLMLHSILQWAVVVVGLFAMVKFLIGLARKSEFAKMDRGLSAGFTGLVDLQILLGFIYFFWNGLAGGAGFPFFRIEHMITMIVAATVAHVPGMLKKKEYNKYAVAFIGVLGALLIIVLGVYRLPGGWSR
jgi:hypothetical protein